METHRKKNKSLIDDTHTQHIEAKGNWIVFMLFYCFVSIRLFFITFIHPFIYKYKNKNHVNVIHTTKNSL